MQPSISTEQNQDWLADLRRQAQQEGRSTATAHPPSARPQPASRRLPVIASRIGQQLWALLHAPALLAGPASGAGGASAAEDDYRRFVTYAAGLSHR